MPVGRDQTDDLRAVEQDLDLLALVWLLPRWAASNEMTYEPVIRLTDWPMLPLPRMKATCCPLGTLGLPEVKWLPLRARPAVGENCQGRTGGGVWHSAAAQRRRREAAVVQGVGREHHLIDEGNVGRPQGVHAEEPDGMLPGVTVKVDDW